jgi:hypothetical protein
MAKKCLNKSHISPFISIHIFPFIFSGAIRPNPKAIARLRLLCHLSQLAKRRRGRWPWMGQQPQRPISLAFWRKCKANGWMTNAVKCHHPHWRWGPRKDENWKGEMKSGKISKIKSEKCEKKWGRQKCARRCACHPPPLSFWDGRCVGSDLFCEFIPHFWLTTKAGLFMNEEKEGWFWAAIERMRGFWRGPALPPFRGSTYPPGPKSTFHSQPIQSTVTFPLQPTYSSFYSTITNPLFSLFIKQLALPS